jgi:hypothetical protein
MRIQTLTEMEKSAWLKLYGHCRIGLPPVSLAIAIFLATLLVVPALTVVSRAAQTVTYSNDRFTIRVDNVPLIFVLEKIADHADIVIFIARGFEPGTLTLHLEAQPLEKTLDRVLKGMNVAKIYHKKPSGILGLSALEIYPGEKFGGPLDVIVRAGIPELEISPALKSRRYETMRGDTLQPQAYVHTLEYDSLVSAALAFEKREKDTWQDIQDLKTQVNEEVDESKNQVLSMALMDRYGEFEQMQHHHIDVLEKMHRVEHFIQNRAGQSTHVLIEDEGGINETTQ